MKDHPKLNSWTLIRSLASWACGPGKRTTCASFCGTAKKKSAREKPKTLSTVDYIADLKSSSGEQTTAAKCQNLRVFEVCHARFSGGDPEPRFEDVPDHSEGVPAEGAPSTCETGRSDVTKGVADQHKAIGSASGQDNLQKK